MPSAISCSADRIGPTESRAEPKLSGRRRRRSASKDESPPSVVPGRYKTELCRSYEETGGSCRYGDRCQFAHGAAELRTVDRHPRYKTELCRTYHSRGFCAYGPRCHFIHNVDDMMPPRAAAVNQNSVDVDQLARLLEIQKLLTDISSRLPRHPTTFLAPATSAPQSAGPTRRISAPAVCLAYPLSDGSGASGSSAAWLDLRLRSQSFSGSSSGSSPTIELPDRARVRCDTVGSGLKDSSFVIPRSAFDDVIPPTVYY